MQFQPSLTEDEMKINAGPSGREVISLQKMDSLLVVLNVTGAKKLSAKRLDGFERKAFI